MDILSRGRTHVWANHYAGDQEGARNQPTNQEGAFGTSQSPREPSAPKEERKTNRGPIGCMGPGGRQELNVSGGHQRLTRCRRPGGRQEPMGGRFWDIPPVAKGRRRKGAFGLTSCRVRLRRPRGAWSSAHFKYAPDQGARASGTNAPLPASLRINENLPFLFP